MPKPKLITEGTLKEIAMQWSGADVPETDFRSINYWQELKNRVPEFSEKLKLAARLKLPEYPENLKDIKHSLKFWPELAEILGLPEIQEKRQRSIAFWIDWHRNQSKAPPPLRPGETGDSLAEIAEKLKGLPKKINAVRGALIEGGAKIADQLLVESYPDKPPLDNTILGIINFEKFLQRIENIQKSAELMAKKGNWEDKGGNLSDPLRDIFLCECVLKSYFEIMGEEGKGQEKFKKFGKKLLEQIDEVIAEDSVRNAIKRFRERLSENTVNGKNREQARDKNFIEQLAEAERKKQKQESTDTTPLKPSG